MVLLCVRMYVHISLLCMCVCFCTSRLWFPCIDSSSELCPWDISVTVPANMFALASGELTEQVRLVGVFTESHCTESVFLLYIYSVPV